MMPLILEWAYSVIACSLQAMAIFILAASFSPAKQKSHIYFSAVIVTVLNTLQVRFLENISFPIHLVFVLTIWMLAQLYVFQGSVAKHLSITLLGSSYLMSIDLIFSTVYFLFLNPQEQDNPYITYGIALIGVLVEFGITAIFYMWNRRHARRREPDIIGWVLVLVFSIPLFVLGTYLTSTIWTGSYDARAGFIVAVFLLCVSIGAICLLDYSGRRQEAIWENTILRQNLKLESEHIAALEKGYTHQREQTHDFKNQLAVLRSMAGRRVSQEEFEAYLNSVIEIDIPTVLYINTHRTVVDIIVSQKVPLAKDKGIDFQFQLDDLSNFPMTDDTLVVVLTNLIDNAIEACEKIPQKIDRHILLKMKMTNQLGVLNIENTTSGPVVIQDNLVETTKDDPLLHGYGLKSVATMIAQSGGMYFLDYREADKMFCFCASIPRES